MISGNGKEAINRGMKGGWEFGVVERGPRKKTNRRKRSESREEGRIPSTKGEVSEHGGIVLLLDGLFRNGKLA